MTAQSWQDVRAKFLLGAEQFPYLSARWYSREDRWAFLSQPLGVFEQPADPQSESLFKDAARLAVRLAGLSTTTLPPVHVWLEFMRTSKRGFQRIRAVSWRELKILAESHGSGSTGVPLEDGTIASVFKESADFCTDLEAGRRPIVDATERRRRRVDFSSTDEERTHRAVQH